MYYAVERIFFFFFQAEDGIRDTSVTGVQTCALRSRRRASAETRSPPHRRAGARLRRRGRVRVARRDRAPRFGSATPAPLGVPHCRWSPKRPLVWRPDRSEERRVGKECRGRGGEGGE